MQTEFRRIVLEAAIIFLLGTVVGLSFNSRLVIDAFSGKVVGSSRSVQVPPVPATTPEGSSGPTGPAAPVPVALPFPAMLSEVRELVETGALLVDARAHEFYLEGHLPKAVSLPLGELDERLVAFMQSVPKKTILVTYCNGYGCPDSYDLGVRLMAEGYADVRVYEGGVPEWRDSGLPMEGGER